jgi:hypothetical protein
MKSQGKIIYQLEIGMRTKRQEMMDDTPGTYRVTKEDTPSGIVVWGRYGERWVQNPGTRELIAHLLKCLDLPEKKGGD